jgi:colicin import membrane protein
LVVRVRVQLTPDGRMAGPPQVLTSGHSPLFLTARDNAIRALFRGQPFTMLRPEHYDQWKDIEITFDPRDMMHG